MAPQPKRKHSTKRTKMRKRTKKQTLPTVVYDKKTGKPRLAHRNISRIKPVAASQAPSEEKPTDTAKK